MSIELDVLKEPTSLKILRRLKLFYTKNGETTKFVDFFNQEGNDFVRSSIESNCDGLMLSKFGTYELENFCTFLSIKKGVSLIDFIYAARNLKNYDIRYCFPNLCYNAGFFPQDIELGVRWQELVEQDIKEIDILGSSQKLEKYIKDKLTHCKKINLTAYTMPFLWNNPWTQSLKGKNVLVIHPFVESIQMQYEKNRTKLFKDECVLPQFKNLYLIKAVQSIAGNNTEFENWFEALAHMENKIDSYDFDVALIGCGAYGMNLAAYCKRKGKIAIHMASYVQLLFGIYGFRWETDPIVSPYINEFWIRPSENERPQNYSNIEAGCYW